MWKEITERKNKNQEFCRWLERTFRGRITFCSLGIVAWPITFKIQIHCSQNPSSVSLTNSYLRRLYIVNVGDLQKLPAFQLTKSHRTRELCHILSMHGNLKYYLWYMRNDMLLFCGQDNTFIACTASSHSCLHLKLKTLPKKFNWWVQCVPADWKMQNYMCINFFMITYKMC